MPSQAVVWLEFLGICWYLLWTLYGLVRFLGSVIQEARSTPENLYLRNLEVRVAISSGVPIDEVCMGLALTQIQCVWQ